MEVNELPERIYIDTPNHGFWYCTKDKSSTEYIRTETFIEKAEKYLLEHLIDYWSQAVTDESSFIEGFKKYMKGE